MSDRKRFASRVVLAIGAFVVPLVSAELGARLFLPPPPANAFPGLMPNEIADPELLWRSRPNFTGNDVYGPMDQEGFRALPGADRISPDATVILSLGESTTFGFNLPCRDTYSYLVERRLRARGHDVRVLNAGTRGWTTFQSTRFLELNIEHIHPQVVLFYHESNDFLPTTFRSLAFRGAGLTDSQAARVTSRRSPFLRLADKSRFLTWLRLLASRAEATAMVRHFASREHLDVLRVGTIPYDGLPETTPDADKPWMENVNQLVRVPDSEREALLKRLVLVTRAHNARLVLMRLGESNHPVSGRSAQIDAPR